MSTLVPFVIWTILYCAKIGISASAELLFVVAQAATTWSSVATFLARFTDLVGSASSSYTTMEIGRPLMPPAAFFSSTASVTPFFIHAPSTALVPLIAPMMAILIGSPVGAAVAWGAAVGCCGAVVGAAAGC